MKRFLSLLLCGLMLGSFLGQNACALTPDLLSAETTVQQTTEEESSEAQTILPENTEQTQDSTTQHLDISQGSVPFIDENDPLTYGFPFHA